MAEHLADVLPRQHLGHPDDTAALVAQPGDGGIGLRRQLRGVGRAGEQHDLRRGVEVERGAQEMRHALLARDPPDEHDRRPCRVDAEALDDVRLGDRAVEVGVDAVVDDVDVGGVERRVAGQDVAVERRG